MSQNVFDVDSTVDSPAKVPPIQVPEAAVEIITANHVYSASDSVESKTIALTPPEVAAQRKSGIVGALAAFPELKDLEAGLRRELASDED